MILYYDERDLGMRKFFLTVIISLLFFGAPWESPKAQGLNNPIVSAAAEATHVIKAACTVYPGCQIGAVYATNFTSTAGFLVLIDAASAPADGAFAANSVKECVPIAANSVASITYSFTAQSSLNGAFATGIVAVLTSAANCFTKTTGTITGFIHATVQ